MSTAWSSATATWPPTGVQADEGTLLGFTDGQLANARIWSVCGSVTIAVAPAGLNCAPTPASTASTSDCSGAEIVNAKFFPGTIAFGVSTEIALPLASVTVLRTPVTPASWWLNTYSSPSPWPSAPAQPSTWPASTPRG